MRRVGRTICPHPTLSIGVTGITVKCLFQVAVANTLGSFQPFGLGLPGFVVAVRPFVELHLALAVEGEDVRADTVQEPAVMTDDDGAAGKGFKTFFIPDDVGGRFSEMCPVGLLPAAVCGIDIKEMLAGADIHRFNVLWCEFANQREDSPKLALIQKELTV